MGCPWSDLDEIGSGLSVDSFITTQMSRVGNALRRTITLPYAEKFALSLAEWRMLSVLAEAKRLPFADLVAQSATDKSLVSRALRLLETRGLVQLEAQPGAPRKGLVSQITADGLTLYEQAMPIARQRQAAMLRVLTRAEREVMYHALKKLHRHCLQGDDGTLEN
jgi:DNA-binding MarR family transcriptional regulator